MRQKYNSFCLFLAGRRNSRFIGTMRGWRNYNVRLEKWKPSDEQRTEGISNISSYYRYPMILSMTLVTNVIFLFLYTCVAIPFKVITCCFAFFFQPLSSMPSAKSTQSKTDASSSSSNSSNPSNTVPLRPASAQKTPTNHSFTLSRSSTQRIVTSTSSPPMKFNPVVVSWFYYSLFF